MNIDLSAACAIIGFFSLAFFGWCHLEGKRVTKPSGSEEREDHPRHHGGYVGGGAPSGLGTFVTVQGGGGLSGNSGGGGPGSGKTVNINIKAPTERVVKRPPVHDPAMAKAVVETLARAGIDLSGYEDWIAGGAQGSPQPATISDPKMPIPPVTRGGGRFFINRAWTKQFAISLDFDKGATTSGTIEVAGRGSSFYAGLDKATAIAFGAPAFGVLVNIDQIVHTEIEINGALTIARFSFVGTINQMPQRRS